MKSTQPDSHFRRLFCLLGDLVAVNLLCALCCLPVITTGASFCAMYTVILAREKAGDVPVVRFFLRSLRLNYGGVILGIFAMLAGAAAVADILFALSQETPFRMAYLALGILMVLAALYLFTLPMVLQAATRASVVSCFKEGIQLIAVSPLELISVLSVWCSVLLLAVIPGFISLFWPLYLLFGLSFPGWVTVRAVRRMRELSGNPL